MTRTSLLKAATPKKTAGFATAKRLPVDEESLVERKLARSKLDLDAVSLTFTVTAAGRQLHRDYRSCRFELLVRQLLAGAELIQRGKSLSYTALQDIYYGIDEFLSFVGAPQYSRRQTRCVADIGVQTAKDFDAWYLLSFPGRTVNRKRYGKIRAIVSMLKETYPELPEVGQTFDWPRGPGNTEKPVESYTAGVFNRLADAALSDVRYVMAEWKRFTGIWNSIPVVSFPQKSLADVCLTLRYLEEGYVQRGRAPEFESVRKNRIAKNVAAQRMANQLNLPIREFVDLYCESGEELSRSGVLFPSYTIDQDKIFAGLDTCESWDIATRTIAELYPTWPFAMPLADASSLVSFDRLSLLRAEKMRVEIASYSVIQSMGFGPIDNPFDIGVDAYFAKTFFTSSTLYPFFLYVQLNTGWNEEVVASITRDLRVHVENDILDPEYVLIWGWKDKIDKPLSHRSSRSDPYSVYNILLFIQSVLLHQKVPEQYFTDSLWQYVVSKNLWTKLGRCMGQIGETGASLLSASFVRRHNIDLGSERNEPRVDSRRMRTTSQTRRRETGVSIDEVSNLMGHADIDTTDTFYDSDSGATDLKNRRIRNLQSDFVGDFRDYQARLVDSVSLQQLRTAIETSGAHRSSGLTTTVGKKAGLLESEVVHLLSPNGQTFIVGCVDSAAPTWPNAEQFVPPGSTCRFFNRCCMCDKGVIFKEALPYVARRILDLERLRPQMTLGDWVSNYGQESHAWQAILDDWNDAAAVQWAQRESLKLEYSLPLTMRGA